jgi:hypothetical protein
MIHGSAASLEGATGLLDRTGTTREVRLPPEGAPPPHPSLWGAWFEIGNLPLGSRFDLTVVHPTHASRHWEIRDIVVENRLRRPPDFRMSLLHAARFRFVDDESGTVLRPPRRRYGTFEPGSPEKSWRNRPFLGESYFVATGAPKPDPRDYWLVGHCSMENDPNPVPGTFRIALSGFEDHAARIVLRPLDAWRDAQVVALRRSPGAVLVRLRIVSVEGGERLAFWSGRLNLSAYHGSDAPFRETITADARGETLAVALTPGTYEVGGDPALATKQRLRVTSGSRVLTLQAHGGGELEIFALDENEEPLRHYVLFLQPRHLGGPSRPESRRQTIRHADPVRVRHLAPGPWSCTIMAPGYPEREKIIDVALGATATWHARVGR